MSNTKTVMGQASNQYVVPPAPDVTDVFSTYLYTGNGSTQTITNGIDLDGKGGLVWAKSRTSGYDHMLADTERGAGGFLSTNTQGREQVNVTAALTSFNSDGFSIGNLGDYNASAGEMASWTFRKAPKFFDVVIWDGNNVAGREIPHSLGTTVGTIIIKRRENNIYNWIVYHRSKDGEFGKLNSSDAFATGSAPYYFGNDITTVTPTSTEFTLGTAGSVNESGFTYVAYLFAHNDGDGEFGPDGDQDIIKCGVFTDSASGGVVDLGWEPQWVLVKNAEYSGHWFLLDNMRGYTVSGVNDNHLLASTSGAESTYDFGAITSTGFTYKNDAVGENIYIAIRRGPLAEPKSGTEVFAIDNQTASSAPFLTSNFPVDMVIRKDTAGSNSEVMSRLTQGKGLFANATSTEQTDSVAQFDFNDGCLDGTSTDTSRYGWMWKRAPGFFDAVAYTGNGTAGHTISHNLGVAPEMIWVKNRSSSITWVIQANIGGSESYGFFDSGAFFSGSNYADITDSHIELLSNTSSNGSGSNYIAYLFASLPGISKVGSYSGDGTTDGSKVIDCGFTSGARFVLIKTSNTAGDWMVYDTVRGIVVGNDPLLSLNDTFAEATTYDNLIPNSSGFAVIQNTDGAYTTNESNHEYIFYAIA